MNAFKIEEHHFVKLRQPFPQRAETVDALQNGEKSVVRMEEMTNDKKSQILCPNPRSYSDFCFGKARRRRRGWLSTSAQRRSLRVYKSPTAYIAGQGCLRRRPAAPRRLHTGKPYRPEHLSEQPRKHLLVLEAPGISCCSI